jgi:PfpI family intracellular protease
MNVIEPTRAVKVDCVLEKADPSRYDALLIPGGFIGPDFIRQSRQARAFVRAFDTANKPIATLCHGPWLLVSAELVAGRMLASWPGIRDDIVHAGGTWRDEPVVVDRNWITSRGPADLPAFIRTMTDVFGGGDYESMLGLPDVPEITDEPDEHPDYSSPKYDLPLSMTPVATRHLSRAAWTVLGLVLVVGLGLVVLRRAA